MTDGHFGIIIVINPHKNPKYKKKYCGFEGWKDYVNDHESYIEGTMRNNDQFYGELKTESIFSEHISTISGRERVVTILSVFIDLTQFIKSSYLSK